MQRVQEQIDPEGYGLDPFSEFAEGVIEILKQYGRDEDPDHGLQERKPYWKDFDPLDPRFTFSRNLAERLATQWLTPEIKAHLTSLIDWEIGRAYGVSDSTWPGRPTESLSVQWWEWIRDGLADLWCWWGEGCILRSQHRLDRKKDRFFDSPYILELTKLCSPQDLDEWKREIPDPVSITTVDGRLGDGLFHITSVVHAELIESLPDQHEKVDQNSFFSDITRPIRTYQTPATSDDLTVIQFTPSGQDRRHFKSYCARINAAGGRTDVDFVEY